MQQAADAPHLPGRWMRSLYLVLGVLSLGVAVIGLLLPLVPTTGPLLLAAFFFARSSQRAHRWLMDHPRFGPFIADFQAGRGIPRRTKLWATVMMTAAFASSIAFVVGPLAARIGVGLVAVFAIGFVLRLPTSDRSSSTD